MNKMTELSPKTTELLEAEAAMFGCPRLDASDIAAIKRLIAGQNFGDLGISFARAIRVLVDNEPSEETARLLSKALLTPDLPKPVRLRAADGLGEIASDIGRDIARDGLSRAICDADDDLLTGIMRALAKIGDAQSYAALLALQTSDSARIQDEATFTRALIAHRLGLCDIASERQRLVPKPTAVPIRKLSRKALASLIEKIRGATYGLTFGDGLGFAFECAERKCAVLFNADLLGKEMQAQLCARPWIAGAIVIDGKKARVLHLVFSQPTEDGAELSIATPTGSLVFVGDVKSAENGLAITLRDHGGMRFSTVINGHLTGLSGVLFAQVYEEADRPKRHGSLDPVNQD